MGATYLQFSKAFEINIFIWKWRISGLDEQAGRWNQSIENGVSASRQQLVMSTLL